MRYANVPLLRLSEVYLSAAEAAYELDDTNTAAQMLNAIITNRTTDATKTVRPATSRSTAYTLNGARSLWAKGSATSTCCAAEKPSPDTPT